MKLVFAVAALAVLALTVTAGAQPIVADHAAVAQYGTIPRQYLDIVKTWWVTVPGESHSSGYRIGLGLLQLAEPGYAAAIRESGTPDSVPAGALRFSRATWGDAGSASGWRYGYGEEDWYTSQAAVARTMAGIAYCNTHGRTINATGFGWCWDMTWHNGPGGTRDSVHNVSWAGSSAGGPQGDLRWGLDAADSALTGNGVCMDSYLSATQFYIGQCAANGWPTTVFFTTGPVDGNDNSENGYQREVKHQYLRQYAAGAPSRVLFDYADILCWSNAGDQHVATWNDGGTMRQYPQIHADNMLDTNGTYAEDGDHIGQRGAIRLAKAMWWMLARLAGWDGQPQGVSLPRTEPQPVSGITLSAASPNPAGTRSIIRYRLSRPGPVRLSLFNVLGQEVRTLVDAFQVSGLHVSSWDGRDERGARVASGVYVVRLSASSETAHARMLIVR